MSPSVHGCQLIPPPSPKRRHTLVLVLVECSAKLFPERHGPCSLDIWHPVLCLSLFKDTWKGWRRRWRLRMASPHTPQHFTSQVCLNILPHDFKWSNKQSNKLRVSHCFWRAIELTWFRNAALCVLWSNLKQWVSQFLDKQASETFVFPCWCLQTGLLMLGYSQVSQCLAWYGVWMPHRGNTMKTRSCSQALWVTNFGTFLKPESSIKTGPIVWVVRPSACGHVWHKRPSVWSCRWHSKQSRAERAVFHLPYLVSKFWNDGTLLCRMYIFCRKKQSCS